MSAPGPSGRCGLPHESEAPRKAVLGPFDREGSLRFLGWPRPNLSAKPAARARPRGLPRRSHDSELSPSFAEPAFAKASARQAENYDAAVSHRRRDGGDWLAEAKLLQRAQPVFVR